VVARVRLPGLQQQEYLPQLSRQLVLQDFLFFKLLVHALTFFLDMRSRMPLPPKSTFPL
jgi:hypothetical protein